MSKCPAKLKRALAFDFLLFTMIVFIFSYDMTHSDTHTQRLSVARAQSPLLFVGYLSGLPFYKKVVLEDIYGVYDVYLCTYLPDEMESTIVYRYAGPLHFSSFSIDRGSIKEARVDLAAGETTTLVHAIPDVRECRDLSQARQVIIDYYIVALGRASSIPINYSVDFTLQYKVISYNSLIFAAALIFSIMLTTMRFYTKVGFVAKTDFTPERNRRRNYPEDCDIPARFESEGIIGGGEFRIEL